jgi:hypothetical protein
MLEGLGAGGVSQRVLSRRTGARARSLAHSAQGAAAYWTKPTLGTGVGSGASRMGPNCFS